MRSLPLPISIEDILHGRSVEWERLEFKEGWNPESILHSICAFANDFHNLGGGYIILGIKEENGQPILPPKGIKPSDVDNIQKEILGLGYNAIQPQYHPISTPYQIDGKMIIVIWVPGGETRPYKAKRSLANGSDWAYYIRKQSSTVRAKGEDERELISLAAKVPYDDRYNQSATVNDLSPVLIKEFLKEVNSDLAEEVDKLSIEMLARQMNIVSGPSELAFPKNIGLMFFNESPHNFFPATQIDVVWFPEGAGGDRFEEKIFRGPLSRITKEALGFIQRNYLKEIVVKYPDRAEAERFWNFPYAAVEEAIVNAVYHRSYEEREPIEVRIGTEDLVVLSFPGPDRSIKMEDLRKGKAVSRRYRNRRIGEFLKELNLTEGRSTGVSKIINSMNKNGSPKPEFESDIDRTYFLIRLPIHSLSKEQPIQVGPQSPTQSPTQLPTQSESPVFRLLMALKSSSFSSGELRKKLNISHRPTFRDNYLHPALKEKLIEMTIPDKPSSRLQKYKITETGIEYLEKGRS